MNAHDVTPGDPSVTEDFNSMWNGTAPTLDLPAGWKIDRNLTSVTSIGTWEEASEAVMYSGGPNFATNASNGTYNYGPAGSNDRCIGGFTTTVDNGTRAVNLMTKLTNKDDSKFISYLDIDYSIEKYRQCANAAGFAVSLYISTDGINWTPAGEEFTTLFPKTAETALGADVVPIDVTRVKDKKLHVHVLPGKDLYIAWHISVASGTSPDKAPGLGIDDINITATFTDSDPDWTDIKEVTINPSETVLVPEVPETVKVLSLNNSLIHYNDQARMFNEIASSMGLDATWTKHTNLGKTLDYHWNEGEGLTDGGAPGAKMTIRSDAWTHIILQEQTALPRTDLNTFRESVRKWVEYIRANCPNPNAVIILPMNWHYAQDWNNFARNNDIMVKNYTDVAAELGVVVCPVAVAYVNKFAADGGAKTEAEWFLPGDDRHPSIRSTYMAALMEYGIIFNQDPTAVTFWPDYTTEYDKTKINAEIAADMRKYASDALKQYKNVVNHHDGAIDFRLSILDNFGQEVTPGEVEWSVEPATASISDGSFKSTDEGEYTVTATTAGFTAKALVKVAAPVTEFTPLPVILFDTENTEYTQDFNEMGTAADAALPHAWRIDRTDNPREVGTYRGALENTVNAGGVSLASNAKNGIYNFGASDNENDRAIGGITTGVDGGARAINVYTHLQNNGKRKISSINLDYSVEKYRDGNNEAGFTVKLYTSTDGMNWKEAGSDFTTVFEPAAATVGAEVVPMETRKVSGELAGELVAGAELYLAWNISVSSGTNCASAYALAIDDVKINAVLAELPQHDYHIYIANETDYVTTGLYAWSSSAPVSEILGPWPGQNPYDTLVRYHEGDQKEYVFQVFGHNVAEGPYNLIFNNNNQGSQLPDFAIKGGRDYYFRATPTKLVEVIFDTEGVDNIEADTNSSFHFAGNTISCESATHMSLVSVAGYKVAESSGDTLSLEGLTKGFYIAVAETAGGRKIMTFVR